MPDERTTDGQVRLDGPASLTETLDDLAGRGWTCSLVAEDGGMLRCGACGETVGAPDLEPAAFRRLEGASDPADMLLVVAVRCPCCGCADVLTLAFGPMADDRSNDIIVGLDLPDDPGWPPPRPADASPT